MSLTDALRCWSTPAAQDAKNDTLPDSQAIRDTLPGDIIRGLQGLESRSTRGSRHESSLALNPAWVSVLMGFPRDWLCVSGAKLCALWATRSSRKSSKRSGGQS